MEQGITDCTAFLDNDAWFLPEPPPAGAELVDAPPPADFDENGQNPCEQLPSCQKHAATSPDCCRQQSLLGDPFMGFEVPPLGHFGVGFPDGHYPETVPGSFTATEVELGQRWSIFDDELFPDPGEGTNKVAPRDEAAVESPWEDEWPRDFSSETPDQAEFPPEVDDLPDVGLVERAASIEAESVSAEEHSECSESASSFDGGKPESVTTDGWSPTIAEDRGLTRKEIIQHGIVDEPTSHTQEQLPYHMQEDLGTQTAEKDDYLCKSAAEIAPRPRQYSRKRKTPKSSEFIDPCDSDSEYTPGACKKKQPRIAPTPRGQNAKTTAAIRSMKAKAGLKTAWNARPRSSTKPRIKSQNAAPRPRETETQQQAITEYASFANRAEFAASATRARFALQATVLRQELGAAGGAAEEEAERLALALPRLEEEFESVKERTNAGKDPVRTAQQARFADSAGDAVFARVAIAAEVLIKVG
ncbi:hypothetical protein ISF_06808 [Cordyceps fumosorosea ARSEF 2679]|uniref:Uncharacterized protein n=1 Tax=Cordyceps fumosorosea (strain ARSEF 2679) TaxID=1081104 RepID=A0A167R4P8_CORFA|nr:hypothetical protein ISF_06808 [Cordyceps fumosorosea ARSEF 2679]OAA58269.1 hypothetical protein ISF_06808 [Cordyceps fumosorosea ARSEF 2679]